MMAQGPLRFSTIGKPILRTFEILKISRFFDNSSRTRARATAMARATARARRTRARARRTRARAKDRAKARRTVGRPDGAIYLAKCATPAGPRHRSTIQAQAPATCTLMQERI